jgi:hypothetical protein
LRRPEIFEFDARVAMESRSSERCSAICFITKLWRRNFAQRKVMMDSLSLFGLFAVTAMLVAYALEERSHWFILAFAAACALGSAYGFLQGAWPFGLVEAIWAGVALRRWSVRRGSA